MRPQEATKSAVLWCCLLALHSTPVTARPKGGKLLLPTQLSKDSLTTSLHPFARLRSQQMPRNRVHPACYPPHACIETIAGFWHCALCAERGDEEEMPGLVRGREDEAEDEERDEGDKNGESKDSGEEEKLERVDTEVVSLVDEEEEGRLRRRVDRDGVGL